jgi:hypothetical protein
MKKVFIAFLAFAVAGGGAFAQGWTFNGFAAGGIGAFFLQDGDPEDVRVAPINDDTVPGMRAELHTRFTNADQNAGLVLHLRTQGNTAANPAPGDTTNLSAWMDVGYGWLNFADNMVTVQGGRIEYFFFNPQDRMMHHGLGGGIGVQTILRPVDGLALGFAAYSAGSGGMFIDSDDNNRGLFSAKLRFDNPNFRITAGARTRSTVGTNGFGTGTLFVQDFGGGNPSAAYVSFIWLGTADLHLAFTARVTNLEEFVDYGDMRYYLTVGHTGLVDGLDLRLGLSFGMTMQDEIRENIGTAAAPAWGALIEDPSPHIWVWFSAAYAVTNRFIPRLDVHYVMGGQWNNFQRVHHWGARDGATFNEDDSFLQIRPAFRFQIAAPAYFELGSIVNVDLGHDGRPASWGGVNAGGARRAAANGINVGAYALMRVSF